MIRYALKCAASHSFDSWFASATAFDTLVSSGHVECPVCGSHDVGKALMTPGVRPTQDSGGETDARAPRGALRRTSVAEQAIARLRAEIEANSQYVGRKFASEAREMHAGERPERAIHGEAAPEEARALIEEGIPILPLPFDASRKPS